MRGVILQFTPRPRPAVTPWDTTLEVWLRVRLWRARGALRRGRAALRAWREDLRAW
jgi:hypothetical protein